MLTLWAIKNLSVFKVINREVVPKLAHALAEKYPKYQAWWHKGVAGVIASHALLIKSAGVKDSLSDIFKQYLDRGETDSEIKSTLQKVQLSIYYQIESDPVPSKVLSWLNPAIQVNVGKKKLVPGIGLNNNIIDQWSDVTRGEIAVEAAKHGESCVNVSLPFASHENCNVTHLAKRTPELVKMKKGLKLPKKVLSPKLVKLIESMTGIEHQSDIDALRANVLEEIAPSEPERAGQQIIPRLEALEVKLDQIIADEGKETGTSAIMEFPELRETLEAMSPSTKRQAEMYTPKRRKIFVEGYAKGLSRRLLTEETEENTESDDEGQSHTHTGTPCVPGALGVLSTARKALQYQDAVEDEENAICSMCDMHSPPSVNQSKTIKWIECDKCHQWFHLTCAGLKREPPKKKQWFCASCK